jgi:signal peptidase I
MPSKLSTVLFPTKPKQQVRCLARCAYSRRQYAHTPDRAVSVFIMLPVLQKIGNTLYGFVVLGVLAFALLFLGTRIDILGYEVKVVQSGSMEPAIMTGSIVVIANTANYATGDVITLNAASRERVPITHRIVGIEGAGARTQYVTKGDANENNDSATVPAHRVIGEVVATIPYVGYLIDFARQPLGFALLVGVPAALIILDEFANIMWEIHKYRRSRKRARAAAKPPTRPTAPRTTRTPTPRSVETLRRNPIVRRETTLNLRDYKPNRRTI